MKTVYISIGNRLLRPLGLMLVPVPPSAKMLREHANVTETQHPAYGVTTVQWLRHVADLRDGAKKSEL